MVINDSVQFTRECIIERTARHQEACNEIHRVLLVPVSSRPPTWSQRRCHACPPLATRSCLLWYLCDHDILFHTVITSLQHSTISIIHSGLF